MPEILDPPEQLPAALRPGVPLDQLRGAANWAERFQPSDASFAQRFRHNRDIREYGKALQAQKAAEIEAQARTNQTAQNFFFRDKQLDLARQEQEQQMEHRHRLFPAELEAKQAQGAATRAMETARITSEKNAAAIARIRAEKVAQSSEQSRQFVEHMNELESRGVAPDDDEYRIGFEIGSRTFPYADKEIIESYKKALPVTAPGTKPSEAQARLTKKDQVDEWMKDRNHWQQERAAWRTAEASITKKGPDKDEAGRRVKEAQTQLDRLNTIDPRSAAPAPTKRVRQNGVIYTLQLQPDGSYK